MCITLRLPLTVADLAILVVFRIILIQEFGCIHTIQGYDYALTFSDEVDLIWLKEWNFFTILFFITRYLPFVDGALRLGRKEFTFTPNFELLTTRRGLLFFDTLSKSVQQIVCGYEL
jgi:Family of unknown function (DUF6533)